MKLASFIASGIIVQVKETALLLQFHEQSGTRFHFPRDNWFDIIWGKKVAGRILLGSTALGVERGGFFGD